MHHNNSTFDWVTGLGCPKEYLSNRVKNRISNGTGGFIWGQMSKQIRPTKEVNEVRRNILLYALKSKESVPVMQSIANLRMLKTERENLARETETLENNIAQVEFVNRQAAQQHRKNVDTSTKLKVTKSILETKHKELQMDIKGLNTMKEIYESLKPPSGENAEPDMIDKCLSLVSTLSSGADKKEVWNKVEGIVGKVSISVLWNLLQQNIVARNLQLCDMINEEEHLSITDNSFNAKKQSGLAQLLTKAIHLACSDRMHKHSCAKYRHEICEYIEKIELAYGDQCSEFREWLPLFLEIQKMEHFQMSVQNTLRDFRNKAPLETEFNQTELELAELYDSLKIQTAVTIQGLEKSLQILKSAQTFVLETRASLLTVIEQLQNLSLKNDCMYFDLTNELKQFHERFDLYATRKISLKGKVNEYRYLTTCINEASTALLVPPNHSKCSVFPMLKTPIYYLMSCFKAFVLKELLQEDIKFMSDTINSNQLANESGFLQIVREDASLNSNVDQIMDVLSEVSLMCDQTNDLVQKNYRIMDDWKNQTMEKIVLECLGNVTVNGATLSDWKQRFTMQIYMINDSIK